MLLCHPSLRPLLKSDYAGIIALWWSLTTTPEAERRRGAAERALLTALKADRTVIVAELDDLLHGFVVVDLTGGHVEQLGAAGGDAVLAEHLAAAARDLIRLAAPATAARGAA